MIKILVEKGAFAKIYRGLISGNDGVGLLRCSGNVRFNFKRKAYLEGGGILQAGKKRISNHIT